MIEADYADTSFILQAISCYNSTTRVILPERTWFTFLNSGWIALHLNWLLATVDWWPSANVRFRCNFIPKTWKTVLVICSTRCCHWLARTKHSLYKSSRVGGVAGRSQTTLDTPKRVRSKYNGSVSITLHFAISVLLDDIHNFAKNFPKTEKSFENWTTLR